MYTDYDDFAWFYNRYWSDFSQLILPVITDLVLTHVPAPAQILDVACGTGQMAALLTGRGYHVTGIDGSAAQLDFARENAPGATFIHADARSFSLVAEFDAAFALFDSFNHIMSLDELTTAFSNVYGVVRAGGWFAFDLNMEIGYVQRWRGSFGEAADDHAYVARLNYDDRTRTGSIDITSFRLHGETWQRSDVRLTQRAYKAAEVTNALRAVGFVDLATYAVLPDGYQVGSGNRTLFVARRPT